jgi:phage shock protein A
MNIFDRIAMLFRSNVNAVISEFEQPEKMLNQIILDMRSQLVKAKQQVAAAIADEKRLRDQADAEYKTAADWENKAMLAIREGRDDLAKQALVRQGEHTSHGQQLNLTWQAHKQKRIASRTRCTSTTTPKRRTAEESPARQAARRRQSDQRNDVPHRKVGVRGLREDGREDRSQRAQGQSKRRDR